MGEAGEGGMCAYSTRVGWEGREHPFCSVWGAHVGPVPLCTMITVQGSLQGDISRFSPRELPEQVSRIMCKL